MTVNQVDWFYIVQNLTNIPVGLLTIYFVDFIGLKKSFWIGTTFHAIGTGVRLGEVTIRLLDDVLDRRLWSKKSLFPIISSKPRLK